MSAYLAEFSLSETDETVRALERSEDNGGRVEASVFSADLCVCFLSVFLFQVYDLRSCSISDDI